MIRLPRPNGPAPLALAAALLLPAAPPALAETACYAGKDRSGRWECACDTATESALTALIMGGHSDLQRKASLAECRAWAEEMNAGTPAPAAAEQREAPTPKACLAGFDTCRAAGTPDAACIAEYNACEDSRAETVRRTAVAEGLISPAQAESWREIARAAPEPPAAEPLPETEPAPEPEPAPPTPAAAPPEAAPAPAPAPPAAPSGSRRGGRSGSSR